MRAGLIDDFIRNILSVPFCPYHFVHTILSMPFCPIPFCPYTILSIPFCPLPFCPRTIGTYAHFQLEVLYLEPIYIDIPTSLSQFSMRASLRYWYRLSLGFRLTVSVGIVGWTDFELNQ